MSQAILGVLRGAPDEEDDMGDIQFRGQLEFNGELVNLISLEFTTNAAQISFVPANGKTFYHIESRLYPVTDTVPALYVVNADTLTNRRADVELLFDTTVKDVLTHDFHAFMGDTGGNGPGAAANTGQYETNNHESMDGNGSLAVTLTSTNTSGTFRVQMEGYIKDTGTSP